MNAVVPLRIVAEKMGVSQRCCKRRLKKLDKRIGGGLLVQFTEGGKWFADKAMLLRYLPGIFADDPVDPLLAVKDRVDALHDTVHEVQADTSAIRTAVGA